MNRKSYFKEQCKELVEIIDNKKIYSVFQPIVSLKNGEIHGYESLSRITEPKVITNPEELFNIALCIGKTWELEKLCRKKIIRRYSEFPTEKKYGKLFINVNPLVMMDETFKSNFTRKHLEKYGISPEKIVIEVTERSSVKSMEEFIHTVRHYKKEGYQIAIDDVGVCYSGLNIICNTQPHYLKIDISLVRDIDKNQMKYAIVKGLVEISRSASINLLAEGIETEEELKTLLELGVDYGQGYYLGKPDQNLNDTSLVAKSVINEYANQSFYSDWNGAEYQIMSFGFEDYKAFEAYAEKYGDERANAISSLLFESVRNALYASEIMKVVAYAKCIVIIDKKRCEEVSEQVGSIFNNNVVCFYDEEDLNRGYMERFTSKGKVITIPLISLAIEKVI